MVGDGRAVQASPDTKGSGPRPQSWALGPRAPPGSGRARAGLWTGLQGALSPQGLGGGWEGLRVHAHSGNSRRRGRVLPFLSTWGPVSRVKRSCSLPGGPGSVLAESSLGNEAATFRSVPTFRGVLSRPMSPPLPGEPSGQGATAAGRSGEGRGSSLCSLALSPNSSSFSR